MSSHHDSLQYDNGNDDMWDMFDNRSYTHHSWSVSSAQASPPTENTNEDKANATFMQQCLPVIDPDAADPFDLCQFYEDTMKYVHPKTRYTDVLPEYIPAKNDVLFTFFFGLVIFFPFLKIYQLGSALSLYVFRRPMAQAVIKISK